MIEFEHPNNIERAVSGLLYSVSKRTNVDKYELADELVDGGLIVETRTINTPISPKTPAYKPTPFLGLKAGTGGHTWGEDWEEFERTVEWVAEKMDSDNAGDSDE